MTQPIAVETRGATLVAVVHLYCEHVPATTFCGMDNTDSRRTDDTTRPCVVCADLAKGGCPFCPLIPKDTP
jgi:hypothetical protein